MIDQSYNFHRDNKVVEFCKISRGYGSTDLGIPGDIALEFIVVVFYLEVKVAIKLILLKVAGTS